MPSRIRQEKMNIAASRALEEQAERTNPLAGRGATPSMGLSQYRGGKKHKEEDESDNESVGEKMRRMLGSGELHITHTGSGTKKGQTRKTARKAYEEKPMSEAMAMGLHLGKHLHSLHGGAFLDEFGAGMAKCKSMEGGNASQTGRYEGDGWMDVFNTVRSNLPAISSAVGQIGNIIPGASQYTKPLQQGLDVAHQVSEGARKFGYGRKKKEKEQTVQIPTMDAPEMVAKGGKKKRAPAGPNDGRRKRAEVVKKVMREKGMSMIEASKYVKAHGLY